MEIISQEMAEIPPKSNDYRSPGLHFSDIIHDIATSSGIDKFTRGGPTIRMEVGFLWEDILSAALKDRLPHRIGEVVLDGIPMSPDGLDIETWELAEYKATWKSSKNNPLDNWRWVVQILGYMKGTGTTVCNLFVLYVNGDYRDSGPQFIKYRLEATEQEIEDNWDMIKNHAKQRGWMR